MSALRAVLSTLLAFSLFACHSTMSIRSLEPAAVSIGSAQELIIFQGQGRRTAREFVHLELQSQARSGGYFSVADRSEEGFGVRIAGRRVVLEGPTSERFDHTSAGLRIDVLEWNASRDVRTVTRRDADGNSYSKDVPIQAGTVLLAFTIFNHEGHAYLAEKEYHGQSESSDMQASREEVIEQAARSAVQSFLNDVTPHEVVASVRLDEDDESLETILETARAGNVALAAKDLQAVLERQPHNTVAAYNLGVFLEAMGEFEQAIEAYDKALSMGGKDYYSKARANCARRLAAQDSFQPGR